MDNEEVITNPPRGLSIQLLTDFYAQLLDLWPPRIVLLRLLPQNAIKRRFNRVLARFTIRSILLGFGPVLGVGLLGFRPPGLN